MSLDDLDTWNMHFRNAGLPLEFHGELRKNISPREPFGDLGVVKLRVIQNDVKKPPTKFVPSLSVRAISITDSKILAHLPGQFRGNEFVLAPAITPRLAEQMRKRGIMFADKRGNCFVSCPGVLIDTRGRTESATSVRGRGSKESLPRRGERRTASLFTPRRAQVSALLLSYPSLLHASIREVALSADVSVGTANQTLDLLNEAGYLRKTLAGYRIDNVDTLLDAWAHAYPTGLGTNRQVFRGAGDLDRLTDVEPLGWVSGESAVPDLVYGGHTAHLYVADEQASKNIIRTARLRRDGTAEVVIRSAFWHPTSYQQLENRQPSPPHQGKGPLEMWPRAPLAVIYADLMSVDDPRLSEVAQQIKSEIKERIDG
ncbi:type IV toxin-antitoxin system AbiEi family antitoxin [Corynebacterium sp. A21]|uniref:type IV toxin-antitoxin system AbiEi family antitoxin n=1 Tax=Corynebacterium sp. A21 TaxID=3457318 RepID=UPI003FD671CD